MMVVRGDRGELVYYFFRPHEPKHTRARDIEPFSADTVLPWMESCADAAGIPRFRSRYRKDKAIFYKGTPAMEGICWGDRGNRVPTVLYYRVPEDLWIGVAFGRRDWKKVLDWFEVHGSASPVDLRRVEMKIRRAEMLHYGP